MRAAVRNTLALFRRREGGLVCRSIASFRHGVRTTLRFYGSGTQLCFSTSSGAVESGSTNPSEEKDIWATLLETLMAQAQSGHADSQNRLGDCYRKGLGIEEDPKRAATLYKVAAIKGSHPETIFNYAMCLSKGYGVDEDVAEGFKMLAVASTAGHPPAKFFLAELYLNKQIPAVGDKPPYAPSKETKEQKRKRYIETGTELLYEAAAKSHFQSMLNLGVIFWSRASTMREAAAETDVSGEAKSQQEIWALDEEREAISWLRRAASHKDGANDPDAFKLLGTIFLQCNGLEDRTQIAQSVEMGVECLQRASDKGDGEAMYRLAEFYVKGNRHAGIKEDHQKSYEYLTRARDKGFEPAQLDLQAVEDEIREENEEASEIQDPMSMGRAASKAAIEIRKIVSEVKQEQLEKLRKQAKQQKKPRKKNHGNAADDIGEDSQLLKEVEMLEQCQEELMGKAYSSMLGEIQGSKIQSAPNTHINAVNDMAARVVMGVQEPVPTRHILDQAFENTHATSQHVDDVAGSDLISLEKLSRLIQKMEHEDMAAIDNSKQSRPEGKGKGAKRK